MRRIVVYLFHDAQGVVDDYIPYKLAALRPFAEQIFVVVNSKLTTEGRAALTAVADTVWVRENTGFDVWGYKEALEEIGMRRLAEFDEIVLMNYTFFGPIFPFAETFDRMDARPDLDFWGLTAHKKDDEHAFHIQSHWIAIRRSMFLSIEFARYWREMPMIGSYTESIFLHETRFTQYFAERGYTFDVVFDPDGYPSSSAIFENAQLMLRDRCPILKRRLFFHESSYLERKGIIGKLLMEELERTDYPVELIWRNVVRSAEPRTLYTNFTMLSVLPDHRTGPEPSWQPRICVLAHIYYEDMTDEIMEMVEHIPVPYDIVVTTATEAKKAAIEEALRRYDAGRREVRVVASNKGRADSAFVVGCRDVLTSGDYDLILKVHSKRSPQDGFNLGSLFKHHSLDNLLNSPDYVANILSLFEQHPTIGIVFPPIVHIGFPTMGHAWFTNREPGQRLAEKLGIRTVFDRSTPVAAYGGMFWARPQALLKLTGHPFDYDDFADADHQYQDGMLGHVLERLWAYAAMDEGYTPHSVLTTEWASINYAFLEYKLQRLAELLPGYTEEQVEMLVDLSARATNDTALYHLKRMVDISVPGLGRALRPAYRAARTGHHRASRRPPA